MSANGHENLHFDHFSFGGRVRKRCSMFAWIVISMAAYVVSIHQGFIKATTLLILTWLFGTCLVARQQQKNAKWHNFKLQFYFEMKNELI